MKPVQHPIVRKGSLLYLFVENQWYFFNMNSEPLGAGAMGIVYVGEAVDTPGYKVAIKQVAPEYADVPSIRERARTEGKLLFRHRNLVEMVGCCEYTPNHGPIFIISNLVRGITLDKHVERNLKSRPDAVKRICKCMEPVLDALEYLHSRGIYHLDIKPSNIMVEDGSNIRLMDLGIASVGDINSSQAAGMVGTPQYAAPEQCSSSGGTIINATTDIYEAGITLYELLTGFNPFQASTLEETIKAHNSVVLPYTTDVCKPIVNVLRRATAVEQSHRFQSASEFKHALQEAIRKSETKEHAYGWIWITLIILIIAIIFTIVMIWNK